MDDKNPDAVLFLYRGYMILGGMRTPVFDFDVEEYSLTNNCEKLDMDALRAEYERLDRILLEIIADMAVLKYHIDYIEKEND